jgi:hypothetical protein
MHLFLHSVQNMITDLKKKYDALQSSDESIWTCILTLYPPWGFFKSYGWNNRWNRILLPPIWQNYGRFNRILTFIFRDFPEGGYGDQSFRIFSGSKKNWCNSVKEGHEDLGNVSFCRELFALSFSIDETNISY